MSIAELLWRDRMQYSVCLRDWKILGRCPSYVGRAVSHYSRYLSCVRLDSQASVGKKAYVRTSDRTPTHASLSGFLMWRMWYKWLVLFHFSYIDGILVNAVVAKEDVIKYLLCRLSFFSSIGELLILDGGALQNMSTEIKWIWKDRSLYRPQFSVFAMFWTMLTFWRNFCAISSTS